MLCAVFVSSIIALTANNFLKISLHAIAAGILVMFFIYLGWTSIIPMGLPLMISIFIAGLMLTGRLMVNAHTNSELIWGFATGILSMLIGMAVSG